MVFMMRDRRVFQIYWKYFNCIKSNGTLITVCMFYLVYSNNVLNKFTKNSYKFLNIKFDFNELPLQCKKL